MLLSAELGGPVTFRVAAERQFLDRLTGAGVPAGTAELLITRGWAILAGENDYTTGTFQQITGHPRPRWRVPSRVPRTSPDGDAYSQLHVPATTAGYVPLLACARSAAQDRQVAWAVEGTRMTPSAR